MSKSHKLLCICLISFITCLCACSQTLQNTGVEAQRRELRQQLTAGTISSEQFSEQMRLLDEQSRPR